MKILKDITALTGNTPLIRINPLAIPGVCDGNLLIAGKCEFLNPTSSVKDRIALSMVTDAESNPVLAGFKTIVEPTSGNTGIGLAAVCAVKGYRLILTMPESMSVERRTILKALGAEIVLTRASGGMKEAISKAQEIVESDPEAIMLAQFDNPANPDIHYKTTANEILRDTDEKVDIFVAGVGTGGTITGVGRRLKENNSFIKIVAVEPTDSPILSKGRSGSHGIQGIGAGFVPQVLTRDLIDEVITVDTANARETSRMLAMKSGLLVGISAGANVFAAAQIAGRPENKGKLVVTILCDTGERYLSTDLYSKPEE
jgi:cysteine synthase A